MTDTKIKIVFKEWFERKAQYQYGVPWGIVRGYIKHETAKAVLLAWSHTGGTSRETFHCVDDIWIPKSAIKEMSIVPNRE